MVLPLEILTVQQEEAINAAKRGLDQLEAMRDDLDYCKKLFKRGKRTADDVAVAVQAVSDARAVYNDAARKVLRIVAAGHPEVQLGAVSRHQGLLQNVPTISTAELTAVREPDDTNLLGTGAVSSVYQLALVNGAVAFKRFKADVGQEEMLREANTLWGLRHPNIVQLLMVCVEKGNVGLVLELMSTSLHTVLHKEKKKLPQATVSYLLSVNV